MLSWNELCGSQFISPLRQRTANTDEAAARSHSPEHERLGMIFGGINERRHTCSEEHLLCFMDGNGPKKEKNLKGYNDIPTSIVAKQ